MERFIINDINCSDWALKEMDDFGIVLLDSENMTKKLLKWPRWLELDFNNTLLVFPGNGSRLVEKYINRANPYFLSRWMWKSFPQAKRIWVPGKNPMVIVEKARQGVMIGIKNVVVIDDVISSGQTCRKLRKKSVVYIPNANWTAVCWVMQKSAYLKGYSSYFAVNTVGMNNKMMPINSLSTLIDSQDICKSYADRNFKNLSSKFIEIINSLRK